MKIKDFLYKQVISFEEIKDIGKSTWFISLLFSVFYVFGKYASNEIHIDFSNFQVYFLIIIVFLPINLICISITNFLDKLEENRKKQNNKKIKIYNKKYIWLILIVLWIPQWLSLFPGCFNYDAMEIYEQYVKNKYSNQYPALYTMIFLASIRISGNICGNYDYGIAVYILIQMILAASVFTYSIYVMEKYRISNSLRSIAIVYYAICPTIYLYVLSFTKDSLFTILLYLSLLIYLDLFKEKENLFKNKKWILLILINTILILLRHNMIYAYVPFVLGMLLILLKENHKIKLIAMFILPIIFAYNINNYLINFLNIKNTNHVFAMLSVPVQQIAYVYNNNYESLTEHQKNKILDVIDEKIIRNYYPEVSDSLLYYTNTSKIVENGEEYFRLWLNIGKNNISNYFNAIIRLNYGYFYPDATMKLYIKKDAFEKRTFEPNWFLIGPYKNGATSILKDIYTINYAISEGEMQKVPILKYMFSIGTTLWIFMFSVYYSIHKKRKKNIYLFSLIILLLSTYLLGSLVMVRYVLILFFALPIFVSIIFNNEKFE